MGPRVLGHREGEEAAPDPPGEDPVHLHVDPSEARCQLAAQLSGPCSPLRVFLSSCLNAASYSVSATSLHFTSLGQSFLHSFHPIILSSITSLL